ncbi:MAG: choice-of-anchor E domain-containing protein, partial [Planctomycetota bacterium]
MTRITPIAVFAVSLALAGGHATADQIVQEGSLSGEANEPFHFDIPLDQFDTAGGTLELNFVQFDFLTSFIGGGTTNGEGGQPTRIDVELDADYSVDGVLIAETHAEVSLNVHHNGPPVPFTFFDSDTVQVVLDMPADLEPWIGTGEIILSADVLLQFSETPAGSANASVGGNVDYSVTYDYGPAGSSTVTVVEDFEDLSNDYGWKWGTGNETIVPLNGNPDAHLADSSL